MIEFRCAFFNFTGGANLNGAWSYRGVETEVINSTHVRCNSSHLTTFVVLANVIAVSPVSSNPISLNIHYSYLPVCADAMMQFLNFTISLLTASSSIFTAYHHFLLHCLLYFCTAHTCHHHIPFHIGVS